MPLITLSILQTAFEQRGIQVFTNSRLDGAGKHPEGIAVKISGATTASFVFDQVLASIGRQPNTDELQLTTAQVAAVGATEKELPAASYRMLYQSFMENGKALVDQRQEGHVKLPVDKKSERLLGAALVGDHTTELIHELVLAVAARLPLTALQETVHAHPTLAESIWKLAKSAI